MRLSEAIRLGAMAYPKIKGSLFEMDEGGTVTGACALGAAGLAVGAVRHTSDYDKIIKAFPVLTHDVCEPPDYRIPKWPIMLYVLIIRLNDGCYWSREQIADWVATVEDQFEAEQLAAHTSLPEEVSDVVPA